MKILITTFCLIISLVTTSYAYNADCILDNGKSFSIHVSDKVMTVSNRWKVYYSGKTLTGEYKYKNRGYTYVAGKFNDGYFTIKISNKYKAREYDGPGICTLRSKEHNHRKECEEIPFSGGDLWWLLGCNE